MKNGARGGDTRADRHAGKRQPYNVVGPALVAEPFHPQS